MISFYSFVTGIVILKVMYATDNVCIFLQIPVHMYVNRNTSLICHHQTIELTLAHHLSILRNRENWELSDST